MSGTSLPTVGESPRSPSRRFGRSLRSVGFVVVVIFVIAGLALAAPRALNRVRGDSSPEAVASSYLAAARSGDSFRIRWLMPTDQETLSPIAKRIERFREAPAQTFTLSYEPHTVAAYLTKARISGSAGFADELVIQQFGSRWYLIHLP
jgi:hypothetical protein